MSKQIAFLLTGLIIAVNAAGCCGCLSGMGYNRCQPCGGCPTNGAYYAPQSMVQTMDQTAYSGGYTQTATVNGAAIVGTPIIASPGSYPTTTVMVPTNSLPPF